MTVAVERSTVPVTAARSEGTGDRRRIVGAHVLLAVVTYVPLLLTAGGRVAADTKTYLYLDPGRLLARAPYMWDAGTGLGTVTHQTIGYLWPMGPWFWAFEHLGVPDWVAQRLWVATIMFAAGAGVLWLLRTFRWPLTAAVPAALLYALTPYVLHYAARISMLLLPWAALPWLVGLTHRALTRGGWRHPALFALVVATVGSVNATALVLAGIGPLLWVPFAVWVHHEVPVRRAAAAVGRIGVLTVPCSLWWIAGLAVQSGYGIDILRYTETVETVARTSLSSEVLRGLGYWFFYGGDKLGPWIEPGRQYTQHLWLVAVGFAVPLLALAAAALVRWRRRAYFVALVVVGTAVSVGAHPYDDPSPVGAAFKAFASSSTAGLALRSTPRALPLVVLGVAVLAGAGLAALSRRSGPGALAAAVAVGAVAVANIPPLWTGDAIGENLQRPETVPEYWQEAAAWLDGRGSDTRVLELPGSDFASYRWGNTVDPITPGLMDRPYVARELIPWGSPASAALVIALDRRIQEGVFDWEALAPVARLMGVGDVVLRADLQYERYRTPRPRVLWDHLTPPPPGLEEPVAFGPPTPNTAISRLPLRDEVELAIPSGSPHPPPVAAFPVASPLPIIRARPASRPVVLAGDAEGLVEAAAAGIVDGDRLLFFSAALPGGDVSAALDAGAELVLTDTNRRRARRWGTVRENAGYTERAGETPLEDDPSDNRLPVFPDAGEAAFTVVEQRGVERVMASTYGNPVSWTPEDRPANALDGDVTTAWRVGAFAPVAGERWLVELGEPVTTDRIALVQPVTGPRNRYITRMELRFDGEPGPVVALDDSSRAPEGQTITFPERTFRRLELVVRGDNIGKLARYDGHSGVGIAEVRMPGVRVDEVVRLPRDLLAAAGERSLDHPLSVVLGRLRSDPAEPVRTDEELALARAFTLPTSRAFSVTGTARLSAAVADDAIDRIVGIPSAAEGGITARSSGRLPGSLAHRASAAVDGDPTTAWSPGFLTQEGHWLEITAPEAVTADRLELVVLADGRHSVPTRLRLDTDAGASATVDLPPVADTAVEGHTERLAVDVPVLRGRTVRVTVAAVRPVETIDYYGERPITMPVGIAELGLPGVRRPDPAPRVASGCRTDLLTVGGRTVPVRISGDTPSGLRGAGLAVEGCDGPVELGAGHHDVRAAPGRDTGFDLDRLVLRSAPGGAPAGAGGPPPAAAVPPTVEVLESGRVSAEVAVHHGDAPFWLVLGQSHNLGWQASIDGAPSLGPSQLVDGYANGWYIEPPPGTDAVTVSLRWAPQRDVWLAIAVSVLAVLACLALIAIDPGRRRRASTAPAGAGADTPVLVSPFSGVGRRPPATAVVVTALGLGAATALVARPALGPAVAGAAIVALLWRRGRAVLTVGAVGLLAAAGGYTVARQWRNRYPPDFGWPEFFEVAHWLAWAALALLAADVVVAAVRRRNPQG